MKAFPVYEALKEDFDLTLIHTGQHFDEKMSKVFFEELKFPYPDIHLNLDKKTKAGDFDDKLYVNNIEYLQDKDKIIQELIEYKEDLGQLGEIRDKLIIEFEKIKPYMVIVFGDVTSTLSASLSAKKLDIDIAHIESGLRSGDLSMPEEVNRILTDHITNYYFVTEQSGVDNLEKEGKTENVYLVGNTMIDTQKKYLQQALDTKYHEKLGLNEKEYILITLHRPSNVDNLEKLKEIFDDLIELSKNEKLVYPIHPRTKGNLEKLGYLDLIEKNENILLEEPLGYLEFTCLMANCKYLITDSGGLQEESTSLDIPCFTLRENTERPCTLIENQGTNQLISKISEINFKECKGSMDLWDRKSSERINKLLIYYNFDIIISSCLVNKLKLFTLIRVINSIRKMFIFNRIIIGFDKIGINDKKELLNIPKSYIDYLIKLSSNNKKILVLLENICIEYKKKYFTIIKFNSDNNTFKIKNNNEEYCNIKMEDFKIIGCYPNNVNNILIFNHNNGMGFSINESRNLSNKNFHLILEDDWELCIPDEFINNSILPRDIENILNNDKTNIINFYRGVDVEYFGSNLENYTNIIDIDININKNFICYKPINYFGKFAYNNHPHFISAKNPIKYVENKMPNVVEEKYAVHCYENKYKIYFYKDDKIIQYCRHIGGVASYRR